MHMTLDARQLKRRYREQWARSNARERFVALALNAFLPRPWRAELTGLGAGVDDYIPRSYTRPEDAFDITLYYDNTPAVWVEVTGVPSSDDMRRHPECRGLCVGVWKLRKAREFRVVERLWFAFVVDESWSVRWLPARLLDLWERGEAPWLQRCRLRGDEREALCADGGRWKRFRHFRQWLLNYGLVLVKGVR